MISNGEEAARAAACKRARQRKRALATSPEAYIEVLERQARDGFLHPDLTKLRARMAQLIQRSAKAQRYARHSNYLVRRLDREIAAMRLQRLARQQRRDAMLAWLRRYEDERERLGLPIAKVAI